MNLTGGIVLYAVIWFMVFFVILPIREKSQAEEGLVVPGTPEGAPADPRIKRKMILTTMIGSAIWAVVAYVILSGKVTLADIDWFNRLRHH